MIRIWLNDENRSISIEDNATGIKADDLLEFWEISQIQIKRLERIKAFEELGDFVVLHIVVN